MLLLGASTQIGLTAIRELGQHGVDVYALDEDSHALGFFSRYLKSGIVRVSGERAQIRQIRAIASAVSPCAIMAISENDIRFLNDHRAELENADIKLMVPKAEQMSIVLSKSITRDLAMEVGIRVPRTWEINSTRELSALRRDVSFPVVLKWANPLEVMPALQAASLKTEKYRYCLNWDDLEGYLARFESAGIFPIISEYCPGYGLGQSFFMWRGNPVVSFQHKRLHEWPPEGGFSTLCEGLPPSTHADVAEKSIALLRRIGWEGAAMVEYRFDPASGRECLMEINGRFWGSIPLAHYSGAQFFWATYTCLAQGREPNQSVTSGSLRCRAVVTETKRLLRILFASNKIQDPSIRFSPSRELAQYCLLFFDPRVRYFVFSWKDILPALTDILFAIWRRASAVLARRT